MQNNRVFFNDRDIIEITVVGDQTVESVATMGSQAIAFAQQQRAAGKPAVILDNLLQIGKVPTEARKLVVDLIKSNDYDKLAMLGSDSILRFGANLILQATGKGNKVRYFEDRDACETWLLDK